MNTPLNQLFFTNNCMRKSCRVRIASGGLRLKRFIFFRALTDTSISEKNEMLVVSYEKSKGEHFRVPLIADVDNLQLTQSVTN